MVQMTMESLKGIFGKDDKGVIGRITENLPASHNCLDKFKDTFMSVNFDYKIKAILAIGIVACFLVWRFAHRGQTKKSSSPPRGLVAAVIPGAKESLQSISSKILQEVSAHSDKKSKRSAKPAAKKGKATLAATKKKSALPAKKQSSAKKSSKQATSKVVNHSSKTKVGSSKKGAPTGSKSKVSKS